MGYRRVETRWVEGAGLTFDETYRLAHLPLVAPDHPLVIAEAPGRKYRYGQHPPVTSLVAMVDNASLSESPAFAALERDVRGSVFAAKIDWSMGERRRDRLHATIAGGLGAEEVAGVSSPAGRAALAKLGPVEIALRGPFTGTINRGRIYLRAYPECRDGGDPLRTTHQLIGRPPTDLYLVGLYNLVDELDGAEARALSDMTRDGWDRTVLETRLDQLVLLRSTNDLVLGSEILGVVHLTN